MKEFAKAIFWILTTVLFMVLYVIPYFLFGDCALSTGCTYDQQIAAHLAHAKRIEGLKP